MPPLSFFSFTSTASSSSSSPSSAAISTSLGSSFGIKPLVFYLANPRSPATDSLSKEFSLAVRNGNLPLVKKLSLMSNLDLNWRDTAGRTAFYFACLLGRVEMVIFLLGLRGVDVNLPDKDGWTPFLAACFCGQDEVVSLLLANKRIDVNRTSADDTTALWNAASKGHLLVVQLILASDREIDVERRDRLTRSTAMEEARLQASRDHKNHESEKEFLREKENCPLVAQLLEEYEKDPPAVRRQLRKKLGLDVGQLFALVVYLCDGYLELTDRDKDHEDITRFFKIACALPMDLQMVLCNRTFGRSEWIIRRKSSDLGFDKFAVAEEQSRSHQVIWGWISGVAALLPRKHL